MIKPEDVKNIVLDIADQSLIASVLNAVISNPQTRAALVRELIAGGHCSPSVWRIRDAQGCLTGDFFTAECDIKSWMRKNETVEHWKGQTE